METVWRMVEGASLWWSFEDLRRATTEIDHESLIDEITGVEHLFIENVSIADTDDALRVLRVIDALYLHSEAPTLYFTAEERPDAWFEAEDRAGVAQAVAEKFTRTVSRLHAMCTIETMESPEDAEVPQFQSEGPLA